MVEVFREILSALIWMYPMTFSNEEIIPLLLKDFYLWCQPMQIDHEQLRKWKYCQQKT